MRVCLSEKLCIRFPGLDKLLNKYPELVSKYRHKIKYLLTNLPQVINILGKWKCIAWLI